MTKGLLFDYGGTIDTNGHHWSEVLWEAYLDAEIPVSKDCFREAYVFGERELARKPLILPEHNFRDVLAVKCRIQAEYLLEKDCIKSTHLADKIVTSVVESCYQFAKQTTAEASKTLDKLSEKFPMVLVSNFYGNIENVLKDFGLLKYFPTIIESAVVGVRKPNPEIFRLGAEALNLSPEHCLVVGDSVSKDIAPAQSIGCQTIWIRGKAWEESEIKDEYLHNCLAIIDNFNEITQKVRM